MMRYLLTAIFLAIPLAARAGLGEKTESVEKDRQAVFAGPRSTTMTSQYKVDEFKNNHAIIREFSSHGVVFGIAWSGLHAPDFLKIFGTYFTDYLDAVKKKAPEAKVHLRGRTVGKKIVVEQSGHMRWTKGRAYVVDLMPSGVSLDEIQ